MPKLEFVNHGVPGAPGFFVAHTWQKTALDPTRRELAVFCFGTNDVLQGIDQDQTLGTLDRVLDHAEDLGVPAFVIGPPPVGDGGEQDAALTELSSMMRQMMTIRSVPCFETCVALGPGSVWHEEAQASDGTHPGAGGYAELAEMLRTGGFTAWLLAMSSR